MEGKHPLSIRMNLVNSFINLLNCFIMYITGEKPGKGMYKCVNCGEVIRLDDDIDTLPPCQKCHSTKLDKVG